MVCSSATFGRREHAEIPPLDLRFRPLQIGKAAVDMTLEARLLQAHIELEVTPKDEHDVKSVPLARYGEYEVRLVESAHGSPANTFDFWLELFDHRRMISVDSGGANDLEGAVAIAETLIAHAKELSKKIT